MATPDLPNELHHWHPVLPARDLTASQPVGIQLHGLEIALFRTQTGRVGAVFDVCPHRRMRLSLGWVRGERLVCKYHGWSFDRDGQGESHGKPKRHACAYAFDAVDRAGAIWIKAAGSPARFPHLPAGNFVSLGVLQHTIQAPMPVVLDNFIEVEHTGTTHAILGYDLERMNEVTTEVITTQNSVRVVNRGPQKPVPWALRKILQVHPEDTFIDDWTTYFSPVHSVYDHWWKARDTQLPRPYKLRTAVFFNPIDEQTTSLLSFIFVSSTLPPALQKPAFQLIKPIILRTAHHEVSLDKAMIEDLADHSTSLKGMRLGRFDRPLGEARKRLSTIYQERPTPEPPKSL